MSSQIYTLGNQHPPNSNPVIPHPRKPHPRPAQPVPPRAAAAASATSHHQYQSPRRRCRRRSGLEHDPHATAVHRAAVVDLPLAPLATAGGVGGALGDDRVLEIDGFDKVCHGEFAAAVHVGQRLFLGGGLLLELWNDQRFQSCQYLLKHEVVEPRQVRGAHAHGQLEHFCRRDAEVVLRLDGVGFVLRSCGRRWAGRWRCGGTGERGGLRRAVGVGEGVVGVAVVDDESFCFCCGWRRRQGRQRRRRGGGGGGGCGRDRGGRSRGWRRIVIVVVVSKDVEPAA
ncbi:hypothetical protein DFJ73DRAFT_846380 [Zopfochytrium polystomum]|nr:hypothetical protein DFJ73DRAFT_846380 [Zopfochytrium polystomum]